MAFMDKYTGTYQEELDALKKELEETGFVLFDRQRRLERLQLEQEERERKAKEAKVTAVVEYVPQPLGPTTIAVPTYTPTPLSLLTPKVPTVTKPRVKSCPVAAVINRPLKAAAPVRAFWVRDLAPGALPPLQAVLQRLKFHKKTAAPRLTRTAPAIHEDATSTMPTSSTTTAEATTAMDTDPPATTIPRADTSLLCTSTTPPIPIDTTIAGSATTALTPDSRPAMMTGYQDPTQSFPHVTKTLPDGVEVSVPVGVRKYVVCYKGIKRRLRLVLETGEIRHVGPPHQVSGHRASALPEERGRCNEVQPPRY